MSSLYRRYRPQTFEEVVGQPHITASLRQAFAKNRVAHAYLFHGPRGTGKTTTARIVAKRANCLNAKAGKGEPCTRCTVCVATAANTNLDIIEIDAASNRGIEDIRALRDTVSLSPTLGKYRVYIIDEVHMLTNEAFAALLKTLEEPPSHAIFILATTELHKVPATIMSRCQTFHFRRATDDELRSRLRDLLRREKRDSEPAALDFIVSRSDGCFRDAESLLGQLLSASDKTLKRETLVELLGLPSQVLIEKWLLTLVQNHAQAAVEVVDEAISQGYDPEQLLKETIISARDGIIRRLKEEHNLPAFAADPAAASRLPIIIRALVQAQQDIAYVPLPLIALQLVILTVCREQERQSTKGAAIPQPAAAMATSITPPPVSSDSNAVTTVDAVRAVWPSAIQKLKDVNPVASTFLRALDPFAIEGSVIRLRAHYTLHRNFFEKPENKKILSTILSELLHTAVSVNCFLDIQSGQAATASSNLLSAAQELFGTSP